MKKLILNLALFAALTGTLGAAEVITYQGRLKESGSPANGNKSFVFDLCATDVPSGCIASASGSQSFQVVNGLFKSTFTVPSVDLAAGPWYLRVWVDGIPMSPVERLTHVPYSVHAASAAYASALAVASGQGVYASTNVFVAGSLTISDWGAYVSTETALTASALLQDLNPGAEDVRVGVMGYAKSASADANDVLAGGNFEAEVPVGMNGAMVGLRAVNRNYGNSPKAMAVMVDSLQNTGTVGETYGIMIATMTGGTQTSKPYAIYSQDPNARHYFAGPVGVSSAAAYSLAVSSATGDLFWVAQDGVHAVKFVGDGSGLTGVTGAAGTDSTKVLKAGDFMSGQLTIDGSSLTVRTGNAVHFAVDTTGKAGLNAYSNGQAGLFIAGSNLYSAGVTLDNASTQWAIGNDAGALKFVKVDGATFVPLWINSVGDVRVAQGSFTVGASTLSVKNSNVGVGLASPLYRLHVSSGAGEAGDLLVISTGGVNVARITGSGSVYANRYYGDGSTLTGISDTSRLLKAGDSMTGPLIFVQDTTAQAVSINTGGLVISTGGAIATNGPGNGAVGGNVRGMGAVDLQTYRVDASKVASGDYAVLAGGQDNAAGGTMSSVSGGLSNSASGNYSTVGGGIVNAADAYASVIAGGQSNNVPAVNSYGAILGGLMNRADGYYSTMGGGGYNTITASNTVLGGGLYNVVRGTAAVIAGGEHNTASGMFSSISGGTGNSASSAYAAVGGGLANSAAGMYAAAAGGNYNSASGQMSAIGGGNNNSASGGYAAIPGGDTNQAMGLRSFAAGYKAQSSNDGTFTWADSEGTMVLNSVNDRARFKSRGGFLVSGSTSAAMTGLVNRGLFVSGNGLVGISTGVPYAALDVVSDNSAASLPVQIWRDSSGNIVSSMSSAGHMMAVRYVGDGSGLTGVTGASGTDVTKVLKAGDTMSGQLTVASTVTIAGNSGLYGLQVSSGVSLAGVIYTLNGSVGVGTTAPIGRLHVAGGAGAGNIVLDDGGSINWGALDGVLRYTSGALQLRSGGVGTLIKNGANSEVVRFVYDGSMGIGTSVPTARIDVVSTITAVNAYSQFWRDGSSVVVASMSSLGTMMAARFVGDGSGLSGVPGDNLGNHVATADLSLAGKRLLSVSTISISGESVVIAPYARDGNYDYAISIGTGTGLNYTSGIGIGYGAFNNYSYGVGVGRSADNNYSNGTGLGYFAHSNNSAGVGVGANANTNNTNGVGVGANSSSNYNYGVGVGAYSQNNYDYGTGVGAYTSARSSSAALGYYARAVNQEALALGAGAKANAYQSAAIGAYTVNDATATVKIWNNGIVISTGGAVQTTGLGHGAVAGNARGTAAVDLQTSRLAVSHAATGDFSVVTGGAANTASNGYAVVAGGYMNKASGAVATVSGGQFNTAMGHNSIVLAGKFNTASGMDSVVSGSSSSASGVYSWAGGYVSSAAAAGAFAWADSQGASLLNTTPDRAWFKTRGGFMVTGSTNSHLTGALDRGVLVTGDGLVGVSTGAPYAALDVVSTGTAANVYAQIWRNSSGVVVASITSQGVLGVSGLATGDNLGNHNATQNLQMNWFDILTVSTISAVGRVSAGRFEVNGSTVLALSGSDTVLVGPDAGRFATGVTSNYLGYRAGYNTTTGNQNNFVGANSGYSNTTGQNNTFVGNSAGYANVAGTENSYFGDNAGYNNSSGRYNAVFGASAGSGAAASYSSSTLAGYSAGFSLTSGHANTLLGYRAGYTVNSGSANIVIGALQDVPSPSASNQLNIGGVIFGDLSQRTVGISTRAPQAALDVVSTGTASNIYAQIWRNSSGVGVASVTSQGVFQGDGSGLTGIVAAGAVLRAGDNMNGQLTVNGSSLTVAPASGATALYLRESGALTATPMLLAEDTAGTGEPQLEVRSNGYRGRMSIAGSNGGMYLGTLTSNFLAIHTNSTEQARFTPNGRFSLGAIAAPAEIFDVAGRVMISTSAGGNPSFDGFFSYGANGIQFNSNGVTFMRSAYNATNLTLGSNTVYTGGGQAKVQVSGNMSVGSAISAYAAPSNGLIVEGKVGIGTATPTALLDVRDLNGVSGYVLRVGTGTSPSYASLVVTTGGIVGVGTLFPSTQTVLHAVNYAADKTPGVEDVTAGLLGEVRGGTPGAEDAAVGGDFSAEIDGVQSINYLVGVHAQVRRNSPGVGSVAKAIGLYIEDMRNDSAGTGKMTDTYGLFIGTMATFNQTNKPFSIYAGDQNSRSYFAGNVGFGTANPLYALEISSAAGSSDKMLMISTGAVEIFSIKGNGEVYTKGKFIGDGSMLTNVTGDGLGGHLASQDLNMAGYSVINLAGMVVWGGGIRLSSAADADATGLYISTGGTLYTMGYGNGTYLPNPRGFGSVDLQTRRVLSSADVAGGVYSTIAGGQSNRIATAVEQGFIGGGDRNVISAGQNPVIGGGYGNSLSGSHGTLGGGYGNILDGAYSAVLGGYNNRTRLSYSAVLGGYNNVAWATANGYTSVVGGANNTANGDYAVIAGGAGNEVNGNFAFLGAAYTSKANGNYSVVAGGNVNVLTSSNSVIGGGAYNTVTGTSAVVAGGENNRAAGMFGTVAGGYGNTAYDLLSAVAGGRNNYSGAMASFVGGGESNNAGHSFAVVAGGSNNRAWGLASAVNGGRLNDVWQENGVVSGGLYNVVSASNSAVGGGAYNVVDTTSSVIAGGEGNRINGGQKYITIGGGYTNLASGQYAYVGGGWNNRAMTWGSAIGGGIFNRANGSYATVAGGSTNTASGFGAFVGAGDLNQAIANYSAVVGGTYNNAFGMYSLVGGGAFHTVDAQYAAVAGGQENKIGAGADHAFIGGGYRNSAQGAYSFVGGGGPNGGVTGNSVDGFFSAIVGGSSNTITSVVTMGFIGGGSDNHLYGDGTVVGGGTRNWAGTAGSKFYGAVLGGRDNSAAGEAAAVPGGAENVAAGNYSFAAGLRSSSTVDGTFSWNDSEGYPLVNDIPNQARFKAKGGFWVAISTDYGKPALFVSSHNNVSAGAITGGPGARLTVLEPNPQPNTGNPEVLRVGTGPFPSMLSVSTAGVVGMPQQSVAIASAPPMALAGTGWNIINTFNLKEIDTQNEMLPVGFTPRSPGRYLVTIDATMNCNIANNTVGVGVTINGEPQPARYSTSYVGATGPSAISFSHVFNLGAGSLVQFYFYNTLASAFNNFVPMVTVTKLQ